MKKTLLLLLLCASSLASGQTTTLSYQTQVFNNVTAPAVSPAPSASSPGLNCRTANSICAIQNAGMGSHWLKYCITGGIVTGLAIELEGSDDQVNWMQITESGTTTGTSGCGVLEGAGYFNWLRVNLITLNGTSPKISAWYSGIGTSIPGGGIIKGMKSSQPVNFLPDLTFISTTVKSSFQTVTTSNTDISEISMSNPNASAVFVIVSGPTPGNLEFMVPANGTRDVPFPQGVQCTSSLLVSCSTASAGTGDPATGCIINILYKTYGTVNTSVNTSGTPQNSINVVPN